MKNFFFLLIISNSYRGFEISNQSRSLKEPIKTIFDSLLLVNRFRVCDRV